MLKSIFIKKNTVKCTVQKYFLGLVSDDFGFQPVFPILFETKNINSFQYLIFNSNRELLDENWKTFLICKHFLSKKICTLLLHIIYHNIIIQTFSYHWQKKYQAPRFFQQNHQKELKLYFLLKKRPAFHLSNTDLNTL